ncbi:MAG: molybdopterin dinucleotide binding domain-containing protein, partial [Ilumatobacteraceae bacterium]
LRAEIARVVPAYAGIEDLSQVHDAVQYGGRHLCADGNFPLPGGRARFTPLDVRPVELAPDQFFLSTRRGKQFNSMIFNETDPLTGASRDAVYIDSDDARELGLSDRDAVELRSPVGVYRGHVLIADLPRRSLQVHWPEGNVLIDAGLNDDASRIPDYNAIVTVHRVERS